MPLTDILQKKSQDVSAPHIHKTVEKSWTEEGEVENYT